MAIGDWESKLREQSARLAEQSALALERKHLLLDMLARLRDAQPVRCSCGNEARYIVAGETAPRYCGICDITENGGRGNRRKP